LDLPKKQDILFNNDYRLHTHNRVSEIETTVKSLESSIEKTVKVVDINAHDGIVCERRVLELSQQLVNISDLSIQDTKVSEEVTERLRGSFISNQRRFETKLENLTFSQSKLDNRVNFIERQVLSISTRQSKDIAKEQPFQLKGAVLGILKILSHSPTYGKVSWFNALGRSLGRMERFDKTVDELLNSVEKPGDCWPMKGDSGFVEFQLTKPVNLSGVSIFHIPESMSPDIKTAPREFRVKARGKFAKSWTDFGKFEYKLNDALTQQFHFGQSEHFEILRLEIISNHGSSEYTCIYHFKVFHN